MVEFLMPSLGADMEAGTLVERLKQPGDPVAHGDIVAVVETEKGAIEVEIFLDGTLEKWLVEEGETVPVGTPLASIQTQAAAAAPEKPAPPPQAPAPERPPLPRRTAAPLPPEQGARILASPAARALAAEKSIDLQGITPARPGPILHDDVARHLSGEDAREAGKPVQADRKPRAGIDLDKMRHAIAVAMARSKQEIPHYYLTHEISLRRAADWVSAYNAGRDPEQRLLLGVLMAKAVALAITRYPQFNGHYLEGAFVAATGVHIGQAIAIRGGGLVAPAIHDCDRKSLEQLMQETRDLVGRVRAGTIRSSELSDPTITVTSLGERGVDGVIGVIYPPQVAIVGFGSPCLKPVAHADGGLVAEPMVQVSLAADHRVTDGHLGARFLSEIAERLQRPEDL